MLEFGDFRLEFRDFSVFFGDLLLFVLQLQKLFANTVIPFFSISRQGILLTTAHFIQGKRPGLM